MTQIEQQLKLYAESLQAKVDEFERTGEVLRRSSESGNSDNTEYVIRENKDRVYEKDNLINEQEEKIEKL